MCVFTIRDHPCYWNAFHIHSSNTNTVVTRKSYQFVPWVESKQFSEHVSPPFLFAGVSGDLVQSLPYSETGAVSCDLCNKILDHVHHF